MIVPPGTTASATGIGQNLCSQHGLSGVNYISRSRAVIVAQQRTLGVQRNTAAPDGDSGQVAHCDQDSCAHSTHRPRPVFCLVDFNIWI